MNLVAGFRPLITALALFSGLATAMAADPADKVKLRYDVTFSGVRALELRYDASLGSTAYNAKVDVALKGIAKLLAEFDMEIAAAGNVDPAGLKPASFRMVTSDEEKNRTMNVSWQPDGTPLVRRNYKLRASRAAELETAVKPGMPDPLTVLMSMAITPEAQLCTGTSRSYNGAEVLDFTFTKLGTQNFGKETKGAYRGQTTKCRLELKPVAGVSEKRLRKWAKKPPVYTIWFAPALAPVSGKMINVIVAAEGEASGRSFRAIASTATVAGAALNRASLASK
ncbi:MAG: DUF3108 domain-containing protein [Aestuariivirgaceae bacterium]|nr:DUF3108 domain-containing protein [Aestuariivirgaceae bacterium]